MNHSHSIGFPSNVQLFCHYLVSCKFSHFFHILLLTIYRPAAEHATAYRVSVAVVDSPMVWSNVATSFGLTAMIEGLCPDTTYFYRLKAINENGLSRDWQYGEAHITTLSASSTTTTTTTPSTTTTTTTTPSTTTSSTTTTTTTTSTSSPSQPGGGGRQGHLAIDRTQPRKPKRKPLGKGLL